MPFHSQKYLAISRTNGDISERSSWQYKIRKGQELYVIDGKTRSLGVEMARKNYHKRAPEAM